MILQSTSWSNFNEQDLQYPIYTTLQSHHLPAPQITCRSVLASETLWDHSRGSVETSLGGKQVEVIF